jgi:hypothetical protein
MIGRSSICWRNYYFIAIKNMLDSYQVIHRLELHEISHLKIIC